MQSLASRELLIHCCSPLCIHTPYLYLLQTTNILERLTYQAELLDKAQKYLAAQATLKDALS
jgi:hypothetical protein